MNYGFNSQLIIAEEKEKKMKLYVYHGMRERGLEVFCDPKCTTHLLSLIVFFPPHPQLKRLPSLCNG